MWGVSYVSYLWNPEVIGGVSDMGAVNQTQNLCKSNKCSEPLTHLSSSIVGFSLSDQKPVCYQYVSKFMHKSL